ncbi:hypothetical protein [Nereida sp. MMG025]|uniref:hypothetical protein n=1 Tax=Nereida sp. MMG025 TaxID=2909981 RepID=UPI001F4917D3|nr:hypothetical protein [Nereida sp. MMG025]MCF6445758.1 hypothetical protein [Nereida sp. MMG025]
MKHSILASFVIIGSIVNAASAQDNDRRISLELNRATDADSGSCQVVFFTRNGLDADINAVTWRLAVLDAQGVFKTLLALPLGALPAQKRRIVQYNLPYQCAEVSEIIINDVSECSIEGMVDTDTSLCLKDLSVSTRTDIGFGL